MALCKHCGKIVETGVMNLERHLDACAEYQAKIPVIDFTPPTMEDFENLFNDLDDYGSSEMNYDDYL